MSGAGDVHSIKLLPDKLKTELALHVNLGTLKKVRSSSLSSSRTIDRSVVSGDDFSRMSTGIFARSRLENARLYFYAGRRDLS